MSTQQNAPASSSTKKEISICLICRLPHNLNPTEMSDEQCCIEAQIESMRKLLTQIADQGLCRGCGAKVYWVEHKNGKRTPYTEAGLNHFVNCPERERFKR